MSDKFHTITGDDWTRSIKESRARPNAVAAEIREKVGANQWAFAPDPESEHWCGPFATKHEAIVEALAHYGDQEDGFKPCVSPCRPIRPEDDGEEEWTFICEGPVEIIDFS